MKDSELTTSICILCNQEKTPDGITTNGVFNCITCGKEWILEKRKTNRLPKIQLANENANFITEFVSIFDSNLNLNELCENSFHFQNKIWNQKTRFYGSRTGKSLF